MILTNAQINRGLVQVAEIARHHLTLFKTIHNQYEVRIAGTLLEHTWTKYSLADARKLYHRLAHTVHHKLHPCQICGAGMTTGVALLNNMSGVGDFSLNDAVCTVPPDGTATLVKCLKCPSCGHSTTHATPTFSRKAANYASRT